MCVNPRISTETKTQRRPRSGGFTLAEVTVAVLILGIVGVTFYAGLAQCFSVLESARHRLRATQILTEKFEVIRLYKWSQITNGFIPATFTEYFHSQTNGGILYQGTIAVAAAPVSAGYTNTMRKAVVSLNWTSSGRVQQQGMETFVSQYGIQTYTY